VTRRTVCGGGPDSFTWIDVVAPDRAELVALANEFDFHPMAVEDCLDPWHLPKVERFGQTTFVLLRVYDGQSREDSSSVQELTRKIAIFYRPGLVVTIHRTDLPLVASIRDQFSSDRTDCSQGPLLGTLMNAALDSFDPPLDHAEDQIDGFEEAMFNPRQRAPELLTIHVLKRRVNLVKRLLWQTNVVCQRLEAPGERPSPVFQDVQENAESYYFYADQLLDEINNLLGIHVALASHRTNEVMRILTVFSAFFLPLTFIVGIYGMNFEHMPEIRQRWGYPAVMGLMGVVSLGIAWWFHRRGWLGRRGGGDGNEPAD
jgi:magnesium transporter